MLLPLPPILFYLEALSVHGMWGVGRFAMRDWRHIELQHMPDAPHAKMPCGLFLLFRFLSELEDISNLVCLSCPAFDLLKSYSGTAFPFSWNLLKCSVNWVYFIHFGASGIDQTSEICVSAR